MVSKFIVPSPSCLPPRCPLFFDMFLAPERTYKSWCRDRNFYMEAQRIQKLEAEQESTSTCDVPVIASDVQDQAFLWSDRYQIVSVYLLTPAWR